MAGQSSQDQPAWGLHRMDDSNPVVQSIKNGTPLQPYRGKLIAWFVLYLMFMGVLSYVVWRVASGFFPAVNWVIQLAVGLFLGVLAGTLFALRSARRRKRGRTDHLSFARRIATIMILTTAAGPAAFTLLNGILDFSAPRKVTVKVDTRWLKEHFGGGMHGGGRSTYYYFQVHHWDKESRIVVIPTNKIAFLNWSPKRNYIDLELKKGLFGFEWIKSIKNSDINSR